MEVETNLSSFRPTLHSVLNQFSKPNTAVSSLLRGHLFARSLIRIVSQPLVRKRLYIDSAIPCSYSPASGLRFAFHSQCFQADKPISMKDEIVRSRVVAALFTMLAPEYLVLNALSEFITARRSIKKYTKLDKVGCLSNS